MNNPPYIIVDVFADIVGAVANKTGLYINYLYGYVNELSESLQQWSESPAKYDMKYPLVWLSQPFKVIEGKQIGIFGEIEELVIFIIIDSDKNYKAEERMTKNYKPILYPIAQELKKQISLSKALQGYNATLSVKQTDRYYWGENQKSMLNDVSDTIELRIPGIKIQHNLNC